MTKMCKIWKKKMFSSCRCRFTRVIWEIWSTKICKRWKTRSRGSRSCSKNLLRTCLLKKRCKSRQRRQEMMSSTAKVTKREISDNRSRTSKASWKTCLRSIPGIRCWVKVLGMRLSQRGQVITIRTPGAVRETEKRPQKVPIWLRTTPWEVSASDNNSSTTKLWSKLSSLPNKWPRATTNCTKPTCLLSYPSSRRAKNFKWRKPVESIIERSWPKTWETSNSTTPICKRKSTTKSIKYLRCRFKSNFWRKNSWFQAHAN